MKVFIPSPLLSYTHRKEVNALGCTLTDVLRDLDRQFPGIRFRMIDEQDQVRPHMRIFVNGEQTFALDRRLDDRDVVHVIQALSGG
jgi:molybdopterin synthase sulfur carrier subunit